MENDKDTMLGSRLVTAVFIYAITLVPFFFGERLHFRPLRLHRLLRNDAALTDGHDRPSLQGYVCHYEKIIPCLASLRFHSSWTSRRAYRRRPSVSREDRPPVPLGSAPEYLVQFILQAAQRHIQQEEQPGREKIDEAEPESGPVCMLESQCYESYSPYSQPIFSA